MMQESRRTAPLRRGGARSRLGRGRPFRRLLGARHQALGHGGRNRPGARGRRLRHRLRRRRRHVANGSHRRRQRRLSKRRCCGCSKDRLSRGASSAAPQHFQLNQPLYRPPEPADCFFLVTGLCHMTCAIRREPKLHLSLMAKETSIHSSLSSPHVYLFRMTGLSSILGGLRCLRAHKPDRRSPTWPIRASTASSSPCWPSASCCRLPPDLPPLSRDPLGQHLPRRRTRHRGRPPAGAAGADGDAPRRPHRPHGDLGADDALHPRLDPDAPRRGSRIRRYLTSLLIFLGLLGTFWGLLQTVGAVGEVIHGLEVRRRHRRHVRGSQGTALPRPLTGMGIAFSSSLFGLSGSLVLGFLDLQAGQAQSMFYNELEDWLSTTVYDLDPEPAPRRRHHRRRSALRHRAPARDRGDQTRRPATRATTAMANLAEGIQGLVQHMRSEQQVVRTGSRPSPSSSRRSSRCWRPSRGSVEPRRRSR